MNPFFQKVWSKMLEFNSSELYTISSNHSYHFHMTNVTKYAYICDELSARFMMEKDSNYAVAKERFLPFYYSVALQKNSAYTDELNTV